MIILETKRLILRTWIAADLDPMSAINQDPKVMEYFPATQDIAQTKTLIQRFIVQQEKLDYSLYAVELKENHEMIGWVGLSQPAFDAHFTPATEIGWRLSSKHWNKGYATEAALAVLDYAFNTLELEEVVSFTSVNNTPSRRVMEKIGLHYDPQDDFDHPTLDKDSPLRRHVLYRMTKENYQLTTSIDNSVSGIRFTEASIQDLDAIIAMITADGLASKREQYIHPLPEQYTIAFEAINKDKNAKLIVAKNNEKVIGVAQLNYITHLTYQGGTRAQIEGVRIHQGYRSQGIGKLLFGYLINCAKEKDCHMVQLTMDKQRKDASYFYKSLGFISSHEGYKLHLD